MTQTNKSPAPTEIGNGAENDTCTSYFSHEIAANASPLSRRLARVFGLSPHLAAALAQLAGGTQ